MTVVILPKTHCFIHVSISMQLLGNEPCVDPLAYRESDYCESATIVDPLDIHEHGQNHLVTTVICGESLFVEDVQQQAVSIILLQVMLHCTSEKPCI